MITNLPVTLNYLITASVALVGTLTATTPGASIPGIYGFTGAPAVSISNLGIGGGLLFETRYDTDTFEGDLIARKLETDGMFKADEFDTDGNLISFNGLWQAKYTVTGQSRRSGGSTTDNRIIFTAGDDGSGIVTGRRFRWENSAGDALTEVMKVMINNATPIDDTSDPVTDWTRGYDDAEGSGVTNLRRRTTVLGNLVHSSPKYLGPPNEIHAEPGYASFRTKHTSRIPLLFAGGGDAMMHAFKAVDGTEVFAFIPGEMLSSLKELTGHNHTEKFLVDGSPTTRDARGAFSQCGENGAGGDGRCWRTILVSGLGRGGNSIFALDVTDPVHDIGKNDQESRAAKNLYLWEFSHPNLGLTTAKPIIEQLSDGAWVAIFGNGQGTGKAVLFVVNLATGTLIQELEVMSSGAGNGLSSPTSWDSDFDGKVDLVYAGDIEGNLWKFDFSTATQDGGANISFSGSSLVKVKDRKSFNSLPITTRPLVSVNPDGGVFVYFGTGMIGQDAGDSNGMFGITDKGDNVGTNPVLTIHSVEPIQYRPDGPEDGATGNFRFISASTEPESVDGWELRLPPGERIFTNPLLRNGRVSFTSTNSTASTTSPNWFTGVGYLTGGAPHKPFLDLNEDGLFDRNDWLHEVNDADNVLPVSRYLGSGVVSAPMPANIASEKDIVFITHGRGIVGITEAGGDRGLSAASNDGGDPERAAGRSTRCDTGAPGDGTSTDCDKKLPCRSNPGAADGTGKKTCHSGQSSGAWDNYLTNHEDAGDSADDNRKNRDRGTVTNNDASGVRLTESVIVRQNSLADGRVSWREVLE